MTVANVALASALVFAVALALAVRERITVWQLFTDTFRDHARAWRRILRSSLERFSKAQRKGGKG